MKKFLVVALCMVAEQAAADSPCGAPCELDFWKANRTQDEIVAVVRAMPNVDVRHEYGWTAIAAAASSGNVDGVRLLLELGADPDIVDDWGNSPMFAAIHSGNYEIFKLLAQAGAKVDRTNKDGVNVRQFAEENRRDEIVVFIDSGETSVEPGQVASPQEPQLEYDYSIFWKLPSDVVSFALSCNVKVANLPGLADAYFAQADDDPTRFEREGVNFDVFFLKKPLKFPTEDYGFTPQERWREPVTVGTDSAIFITNQDDKFFSVARTKIEETPESYEVGAVGSFSYAIGNYEFWEFSVSRQTGIFTYSRNVALGDGWSDIYEISADNGKCEKLPDETVEARLASRWSVMNEKISKYNVDFVEEKAARKAEEQKAVDEQKF